MNGSNFKIETLFVSFTAIITPEILEMAQIFISEIERLAALKCRATNVSQNLASSSVGGPLGVFCI